MRFLFIINPGAGTGSKNKVLNGIYSRIPKDDYQIITWKNSPAELEQLIKNSVRDFSIIVAVGGDGTVNLIASSILRTNIKIPMAIIPCGSGNGLARFLKIPLKPQKAVELLYNGKISCIDTCTVNHNLFLSTCGIGFDAKVSHEFASSERRGFFTYLKIVMKYYRKYKAEEYRITVNENSVSVKAMLITIANSNQFGNNVIIAPEANIRDGLVNITIIKPFPVIYAAILAFRLFRGNINHSRYVRTFTGNAIKIECNKPEMVQFDGEPMEETKNIEIKVNTRSLNIMVP